MTVEPQIDYETLLQEAFREAQRGVVRNILGNVAQHGLPGEHHFYISFNTLAPGVSIAPRLLAKYPSEMTIVLQHRFWDLHVQTDRFEVKLTFDSIRERLVIPFSSVRVFFDPSVPYGLQFDETTQDGRGGSEHRQSGDVMGIGGGRGSRGAVKSTTDRKKVPRKSKGESAVETAEAATPERKPAEELAERGSLATADAAKPDVKPVKTGPRLVETANDSTKVVSLDQFRKK